MISNGDARALPVALLHPAVKKFGIERVCQLQDSEFDRPEPALVGDVSNRHYRARIQRLSPRPVSGYQRGGARAVPPPSAMPCRYQNRDGWVR